MAKMYPPEYRSDSKSGAERKVFDLLKLQTSGDWSALHSVGVTSHKSKPWAEIDFVIIGPSGVYCLEVKGGRIERVEGKYRYTNRRNEVTVKDHGPFEQVGPASAALYNFLKDSDFTLKNVPVGYGVITPDITFKINGPDIINEVIFDERDLSRPFSEFLSRLSEYWHRRLTEQNKQIVPVDDIRHKKIFNLLRGDFDLRPSLKTRVGLAKEELLRLTDNQYRILDGLVEDNDRVMIRGCAGSGKTLLAIEEARRRGTLGEKVLLFCFNKQLGERLKTAVADLPGVEAGNLHSFMAKTIKAAGLESELPQAQKEDLLSKFYPLYCTDALLQLDKLASYDALIVDEAQDLITDSFLEVFDALLRGGLQSGSWVMFLDPNQNIFSKLTASATKRLEDAHPAKYKLTINCRNTSPVAIMTNLLSGISCAPTLKVDGPEVTVHRYKNVADQQNKIASAINRVLGQKISPEDIVILGKKRLENSLLKNGVVGSGLKVRDFSDKSSEGRYVRYSTVKSFKGLEADCIMLIDIDNLQDQDELLDLYVGGSRACAYLEVFISENIEEQYLSKAREFGESLSRTS